MGYPQPQYPPPHPQQEHSGTLIWANANPHNPTARHGLLRLRPAAHHAAGAKQRLCVCPHRDCFRDYIHACFISANLFTGLIFCRGSPEFQIEAFFVPYFNVTDNSTLKASWEANITAKNPSHKLEFFLANIEGSLVYRGRTVDLTLIDPLYLGINGEDSVQANFSSSGAPDRDTVPRTPEGVLRQMVEDRKIGSAEFDLKMVMEATFSSIDTFWRTRNVLRVHSVDIRMNFLSPTRGGTWDGASGVCLTFA